MIIKIISIICIRIISITIITTSIGTSEEDVERLVAAMDVDGDGKVTYQEYLNSFRLLILQTILLMVKLMLTKVNGGRAKGLYFYYFLQFLDGCLSPRVTFLINSRFCNFAACTAVTICAVLFLQFFKSVADDMYCNCYSRCSSQSFVFGATVKLDIAPALQHFILVCS